MTIIDRKNETLIDLKLSNPIKFLGCTVLSFNGTLGLGLNPSTLTVNLVEDCATNDSFLPSLNESDTKSVIVGDSQVFEVKASNGQPTFSFGGILTSFKTNKGSNGETYTAYLEDHRNLFDNISIIIDSFNDKNPRSYAGGNNTNILTSIKTNNYINVYQHFEGDTHNGNCTVFGSGQVTFNGGMPINKIVQGLIELNPKLYSSTYSSTRTGGDGTQKGAHNFKWNSLIPSGVQLPLFARLKGPKISLQDLITEICDLTGFEYYCNWNGSEISIGYTSLNNQPNSFLSLFNAFKTAGNYTDISYGQELRNEKNKNILIGDNIHRMFGATSSIPFFGYDDVYYNPDNLDPLPIVPTEYDDNGFIIQKTFKKLNMQLHKTIGLGPYRIHELDIRAALSSFDLWLERVMDKDIDDSFPAPLTVANPLGLVYTPATVSLNSVIRSFFGIEILKHKDFLQSLGHWSQYTTKGLSRLFVDYFNNPSRNHVNLGKPELLRDLEVIHEHLVSLGTTYYGKQYLIPLDFRNVMENGQFNQGGVCANRYVYNFINGEWVFTAEPSTTGAWLEGYELNFVGLNAANLLFFRNENDGKVGCFARFTGALDLSELDEDSYIVNNTITNAFVKATIDSKFIPLYIGQTSVLDALIEATYGAIGSDPTPNRVFCALVTFDGACKAQSYTADLNRQVGWVNLALGVNEVGNYQAANTRKSSAIAKANIAGRSYYDIQGAADISSLNSMGYSAPMAYPSLTLIPLRYNNKVYGPWSVDPIDNTTGGGVEFEQNTEISPWTFGSTAAMNYVAANIVSNMNTNLKRSEVGSVTFLGMPTFSGLTALGNYSNIANLSNINVSFGDNGVTSTYDFKTYTPKFGKLNKLYIEKFKEFTKQRLELIKKIQHTLLIANTVPNRMSKLSNNPSKSSYKEASLSRVLVGETYDCYSNSGEPSQRTIVGTESLHKLHNEMVHDYRQKAFMSLDAIFSPVSINGNGNLPQFTNIQNYLNTARTKSFSIQPIPPFTYNNNKTEIDISQYYLNPLTNPFPSGDHYHNGSGLGHVVDIVGREEVVPKSGICTNLYPLKDNLRYSNDYRFLALKGPLVLQSWGYDTQGKPIPNAADNINNIKNAGNFTPNNLKDEFYKDWLHKPNSWPVGPVDLRFDRERGVWTAPTPPRLVVAKATQNIEPYKDGDAIIISDDGQNLYDKDGQLIDASENGKKAKIKLQDKIGASISEGQKGYAYFDTFTSKYFLLGSGGGVSMRLGKYGGFWSNEMGRNIKVIDLYVQNPTNLSNPFDWVKEEDEFGNFISATVINFFGYIPSKSNSDRESWCLIMPLSNNAGTYADPYDNQYKTYESLWLLLAAEV